MPIPTMQRMPFFREFSLGELHLLYSIGLDHTRRRGQTLGVGGQPLPSMWVLLQGRLAVHSPIGGGAVSYLEGPDVWGVAALTALGRPRATAVTDTECRLLEVPAASVQELCERNARFGYRVYRAVADHVLERLATITDQRR